MLRGKLGYGLWVLGAVALGATLQPALAQSVNIDLGFPGNGPPSSYRAAGLPGFWHSLEATVWGEFHNLRGLDGAPIAARVRQIGGTEIVEATPVGPTGGDQILLGDALVTHAVENCLFFEGLELGTYEVISYTWMPTAPTTLNHVWIDFHPDEPIIGGAWPAGLVGGVAHDRALGDAEGAVFARHIYETTDGVINMHSGIPTGEPAFPGAALNGIQLRKMVPEPPLYMNVDGIDWLASLDAARYDIVRGDIHTLQASGGDFTLATEECVAINVTDTRFDWTQDPAPGEGDFFLVRGRSGLNGMTWNAPGGAQAGDRDFEIPAAVGCP